MSKFSIITPVHLWSEYRVEMFLKTIESLRKQSSKDFEWIVINDGSVMPFNWELVRSLPFNTTIITKDHEERVLAYNEGFKQAIGEWFVLLDSDDELRSDTIDKLSDFIEKYPKEKMFNFGCNYNHKDGQVTQRDSFKPKKKRKGHEIFGGGNIVNGTFIFHKSVYKKLGAYPESQENVDCTDINYKNGSGEMVRNLYMGTPYDFSAAAQLEFPEIRKYFMVNYENEPDKIIKELGNPWGQDYYLFYKYTRKYHSRPIDEHLYIVNPR